MNKTKFVSLKYGPSLNIFLKSLLFFTILTGIYLLLFSCFILRLKESFAIFVITICLALLLLLLGLLFLVKDIRRSQKIQIWLHDAVRLKAMLKMEYCFPNNFVRKGGIKLFVSFRYKDELLRRESGTKPYKKQHSLILSNNGYYLWGLGLEEGEIDILYSPTFNEVILFKEQ